MQQTLETLLHEKIVAVVRTPSEYGVMEAISALNDRGVKCFEITMTIKNAVALLKRISKERPDVLIGAGTVLTAQAAEDSIKAGAQFVVSPIFVPEVVKKTLTLDKVVIPGALTPTEVVRAWVAGAHMVKIFPAARLGPVYLKDLKAPLPDIKLMPTGGITAENVGDYLRAGADALGVGSWLVNNKAIARGDFDSLKRRAEEIIAAVQVS